MRRLESKEQDRAERSVQGAQHYSARDDTTADKEYQRGTRRARTTSTGNPGLRTTPREDTRMGVCPRQTVLRVDSRSGRCYSVDTAREVRVARGTVMENVSEGDELTEAEVAHLNNEAGPREGTGRPDGTSPSDDSTTKDDGEVQWNLKTMNEQQRTMLRKTGGQYLMDEIDQLTTSEARHTDLAEIGHCDWRTNTAILTRDTGCDLLTREGRRGGF